MSPFFRFPDHPTTRYLVEWRRRIPSHELMSPATLESANLDYNKPDTRSAAGKWFWKS